MIKDSLQELSVANIYFGISSIETINKVELSFALNRTERSEVNRFKLSVAKLQSQLKWTARLENT